MALGSDFAGVLDVDWALSTVDGELALGQAIMRRLTTPLGGLEDDPTYGYDIRDLIGAAVIPSIVEQRVLEQVLAEQEVQRATVQVTQNAESLFIDIRILTITGTASLTIAAASVDGGTGPTFEALFNGLPILLAENDTAAEVA